MLGGPQIWSGRCGDEKILLPVTWSLWWLSYPIFFGIKINAACYQLPLWGTQAQCRMADVRGDAWNSERSIGRGCHVPQRRSKRCRTLESEAAAVEWMAGRSRACGRHTSQLSLCVMSAQTVLRCCESTAINASCPRASGYHSWFVFRKSCVQISARRPDNLDFSPFYSICLDRRQDSTWNEMTASSFHIFSSSLFIKSSS
jgi:hypothetical protein